MSRTASIGRTRQDTGRTGTIRRSHRIDRACALRMVTAVRRRVPVAAAVGQQKAECTVCVAGELGSPHARRG
jgi:hypothetical protein